VYIEIYSKTINIVFEKMELGVQIDMLKNLNAGSIICALNIMEETIQN